MMDTNSRDYALSDELITQVVARAVASQAGSPYICSSPSANASQELLVRGPHAQAVAARALSAGPASPIELQPKASYHTQPQVYRHAEFSGTSSTLRPSSFEDPRLQSWRSTPNLTPRLTIDSARPLVKDYQKYYQKDSPTKSEHNGDQDRNSSGKQSSKDEEKRCTCHNENKSSNIVGWDGPDDPENPMNWPTGRKWLYTVVLGLMTFVVTFASSVFSTVVEPTSQEFGVSQEVMILGVSLFVLGFAWGPIIWGPLSELYGRKLPLFLGYAIFAIFQVPVAVAQNLETIMLCRFFGGLFASAPLAVVGGTLADFFEPVNRGLAVCVFSGATFIGPVAGPIVGGFVTMSYLGWRWTAWLTLIMAGAFGLLAFFIVPESFAPVLLKRRAQKLRFETKNWALHAPMEEKKTDLKEIVNKYILKPFQMMIMEPILVLITLYMSFIYGLLYLFFEAYLITFSEQRGWNLGVGALPFISIIVGVVLGAAIITYTTKTRFKRKLKENGHVVPEERLVPMIIGGAFLPIGLFWFAWTSSPHITPWPQIISGVFVGAGIQMIFLQGLNYIIDVYKMHANSAIAGNTFFRSWVGAGFPMFATGMYHNLGVNWATSLLGFLAVALFPVPVLFYIYGEKIRKLSKYSPT